MGEPTFRMDLPTGRGFYLWKMPSCERGDVTRIIERCVRTGVSWLAIKAGDQGHVWAQFTPVLVKQLQAAGIRVFGWSYDVPGQALAQAKVVRHVLDCGANGFITDSEIEWDNATVPDAAAREYVHAIGDAAPGFLVLDAPWPIIRSHGAFPFTEFGRLVGGRCPQVYWVEMTGGAEDVFVRYRENWTSYESKPDHPRHPHFPSGSLYHKRDKDTHAITKACMPADVATFERMAFRAGCLGVLHWEWSQVPALVWAALESGEIPCWGNV
jgi:hypothetical protein